MNIQISNPFILTWTLTDNSGDPINNATVTATLYAGRQDPTLQPGVPVPGLSNVSMPYVPNSEGQYSAQIAAFQAQLGPNYVLVIEAVIASAVVYHVEEQTTLTTRTVTVEQPQPQLPKTFQPRFIFDGEIDDYGLPSKAQLRTIMNVVDAASSLIDSELGRIDGLGGGSLVYTSYSQRLYLPSGRNLFRVSFTPLISVDASTIAMLQGFSVSGDGTGFYPAGNHYWTGCQPNTVVIPNGALSPIISASGRYGYGRRDQQSLYPDMNYGANILQVASFFGGPPQWTGIDVSMIDQYSPVGECWVPAGLYLSQYSEILITYNSGWNPLAIPAGIKHATAALARNFITRGGGTTAIRGYSAGRIRTQFTPDLLDGTVETWLAPFRKVNAM